LDGREYNGQHPTGTTMHWSSSNAQGGLKASSHKTLTVCTSARAARGQSIYMGDSIGFVASIAALAINVKRSKERYCN
jgi:ApbE superfamily uncharacterized protein (UPF0280 family)